MLLPKSTVLPILFIGYLLKKCQWLGVLQKKIEAECLDGLDSLYLDLPNCDLREANLIESEARSKHPAPHSFTSPTFSCTGPGIGLE